SGTAREHGAAGLVARPIRAPGGEGFSAGLLVVWAAHHLQQLPDAGVVLLLGAIDRLLGEVVAQHEAWIRRVHARTALGGWRGFLGDAGSGAREPFSEGWLAARPLRLVVERTVDRGERRRCEVDASEASKEERHVGFGRLQERVQLIHQPDVLVA